MIRTLIPGALYGEMLPSGHFVALIKDVHYVTHAGVVAFPPGETFGPVFPRCTDVEGFRFAAQAHDTLNPATWEWDVAAGGWVSYPPPCCGVSPVIYDHDGVLHRSDCGPGVGSQGYRYVNEANIIVSGDATYRIDLGAGRFLFEYTALAELLIGQAAYDGGGVQVWDGVRLLQLETGDCRFIRANRDGDIVALAFTRPEGVVLIRTTMAELRALPPVVLPVPPDPTPIPPVPPDPPQPQPEPPGPQPIPPIPVPSPSHAGDLLMFSVFTDPTKQLLAVKGPKSVSGGGTVLENMDGTIVSIQPDGRVESRPADADGGFERCNVAGSVATWKPGDKPFTFGWVSVDKL